MSNELLALFATAVTYLVVLFLIAYATDSGILPRSLVRHPLIYVLSLGVYATSWSFYGSVGFAAEQGYQFLTIYLGVTLAFLLSPVLLRPLLHLVREYQLISLADLFAFRYRSQLAGAVVTLFMLVGTLPYIALQIRAVTESLYVLTDEATPQVLALTFCATLILFAILFGARHISPREKHQGLVVAIAFESLVKLLALLVVGGFALFGVFSGPAELDRWLSAHPEALEVLYRPVGESPWFALVFLAFAAAFLLPRQFHMGFTENLDPRGLSHASWGLPLFLLLLNVPILPILWAGQRAGLQLNPDYYVLGITLHQGPGWLSVLAFIGGVSAASAMVIVTTLALSAMSLNHLLLPASYPDPRVDLYRWLLWGRRILIAMIIFAGYGFYALLEHNAGLVQLGLISFVAVAQFMPGLIGVLYWNRANRYGFLAGLGAGIAVWGLTLLVPLLARSGFLATDLGIPELIRQSPLDPWAFATFWSLTANSLLFFGVSLLTPQSRGEQEAAQACCSEAIAPLTGVVSAGSPSEFREGLAQMIGRDAAEKEVSQALEDLAMSPRETRRSELRRLRERIERNLSGLIGPQLAHMIINQQLRLNAHTKTALAESMRYVEERLEESHSQLRGLSADLDNLRRYHRQILLDLPLGACAVDPEQHILIWNLAMEEMTKVSSRELTARSLASLPPPWGDLLNAFAVSADSHVHGLKLEIEGRPRWYNLHKATIPDLDLSRQTSGRTGLVMMLEDLTDVETLEAELAHSDRLASVGRLAAGVAHEIGNPLTAIASLAQNLRAEVADPEVASSTDEILNQTRRITRIVRSLMNFSHGGIAELERQRFPVRDMLEDAINLVRLTHEGHQVTCTLSCPEELELQGDKQRLSQMLVNLCTNACDASQPGDRVEILAFAEQGAVNIEVRDRGLGIAEAHRAYLFEPFYTTKPAGQGTGLGLPIASKIVEEHHGSIQLESVPGSGTRVLVRLPLQPQE
jgi:Na+/proline symporter/signal transduction histidine kinase